MKSHHLSLILGLGLQHEIANKLYETEKIDLVLF